MIFLKITKVNISEEIIINIFVVLFIISIYLIKCRSNNRGDDSFINSDIAQLNKCYII